MNSMFDLYSVIDVSAIIIATFLGFHFLFLKRENRWADVFLSIYFLMTALSVSGSFFFEESESLVFLFLSALSSPFFLAPVLLFYTLYLTRNTNVRSFRYLFLFGAVSVLISSMAELFQSNLLFIFNDFIQIFGIAVFDFFVYYILFRQIVKHNKSIRSVFSSIENKQLNWLRFLVLVNLSFTIIWFCDDFLRLFLDDNIVSNLLSGVSQLWTCVSIFWIGFASLRQSSIFEGESMDLLVKEDSSQTDALDSDAYQSLLLFLDENKIFTNENLTLGELAKQFEVAPKYMSQLINSCSGNSFYHFINQKRIEYFIQLKNDPEYQNYSLEGLSQLAGFKSKTTFYSAFKRTYGQTPGNYNFQNIS